MAGFEPTATQKPGFLPNLSAITQDFAQKTRFLGPSTLRTATQKPGFLSNLSAFTKNLGKNPVSRPLHSTHCDSETGFFPKSVAFTKNLGKNPVSRP
jgi:hypothetical protein